MKRLLWDLIGFLVLKNLQSIIFEVQKCIIHSAHFTDSIVEWQNRRFLKLDIMLLHEFLDSLVLFLLLDEKVNFNFIFLFPLEHVFLEMILNKTLYISKPIVELLRIFFNQISQIIDRVNIGFLHFIILVSYENIGIQLMSLGTKRIPCNLNQRDLML